MMSPHVQLCRKQYTMPLTAHSVLLPYHIQHRRLLNDESPRIKALLREVLYGNKGRKRLDIDRLLRFADGLSAYTTDALTKVCFCSYVCGRPVCMHHWRIYKSVFLCLLTQLRFANGLSAHRTLTPLTHLQERVSLLMSADGLSAFCIHTTDTLTKV